MKVSESSVQGVLFDAFRSMASRLAFFCLLFISTSVSAFLSGPDICRLTEADRPGEIGVWVDVPVDYSKPSGARTQIYAWTLKPFNRDLESFVFFVGGPGASAHQIRFRDFTDWNVIYFDQRGMGCSRPGIEELARDGRFYSSEAIARDADRLRQKMGIQKWSVYAHSYGTAPGADRANKSYFFSKSKGRRTVRTINWRLRAQILIRDNCICKMCGASPSKNSDVVLHVDHIKPWAKGGETEEENLQTLCSVCNIGKSDEEY